MCNTGVIGDDFNVGNKANLRYMMEKLVTKATSKKVHNAAHRLCLTLINLISLETDLRVPLTMS